MIAMPHANPAGDPSEAMTRWHGTNNATGLRAHAPATARAAVGLPRSLASSAYVRVEPGGISRSRRHTASWNAVPPRPTGTSDRAAGSPS